MSINFWDKGLNLIGYETDDMRKVKEAEISNCVDNVYNSKKDQWTSSDELGLAIDIGLSKDAKNYIEERKDKEEYLIKKKLEVFSELNKNLENKNKQLEELLKKFSSSSSPKYYESEESKRIRAQNERERQNRVAASQELPKSLDIVKKDFFTKLNDKILNMKEKINQELSHYSPADLKIFLQKLAENENLKIILIEYVKKESEKILLIFYKNSTHFNILLLGKTGVGKSTLINGIFDYSENEGAKTGEGQPITQKFDEYTSDKRKGLRLIDSKGIEMGDNNINAVLNSAKQLIEQKAVEGNPDKLIHCIWYCFKSDILRFENIEKETLSLLMNQYEDNQLPIIIVITQNYDDNNTEKMLDYIKKEFQILKREMTIMPVVAKNYIQVNKKREFIIEKDGIEELLKISLEKSQKAILPAVSNSIKEKTIQAFEEKAQNKINKLKINLQKNVEKILNGIKEEDKIEDSVSKLSTIIKKTLNIIFEIGNYDDEKNIGGVEIRENEEINHEENAQQNQDENQNQEQIVQIEQNREEQENNEIVGGDENNNEQMERIEQNREEQENNEIVGGDENNNEQIEQINLSQKSIEEINLFLDDLCKWCIGSLNDIISESLKDNSNELKELLFKEQEKVKNDKNVKGKLDNEKSLDDYKIQSEIDLKPLIMNKVYFLAMKEIFNIISKNLVEVSEAVIKEQFDMIKPELRNYIPDDKLKKLSGKILEEIIKDN